MLAWVLASEKDFSFACYERELSLHPNYFLLYLFLYLEIQTDTRPLARPWRRNCSECLKDFWLSSAMPQSNLSAEISSNL
jgi:hypothetical protein